MIPTFSRGSQRQTDSRGPRYVGIGSGPTGSEAICLPFSRELVTGCKYQVMVDVYKPAMYSSFSTDQFCYTFASHRDVSTVEYGDKARDGQVLGSSTAADDSWRTAHGVFRYPSHQPHIDLG